MFSRSECQALPMSRWPVPLSYQGWMTEWWTAMAREEPEHCGDLSSHPSFSLEIISLSPFKGRPRLSWERGQPRSNSTLWMSVLTAIGCSHIHIWAIRRPQRVGTYSSDTHTKRKREDTDTQRETLSLPLSAMLQYFQVSARNWNSGDRFCYPLMQSFLRLCS